MKSIWLLLSILLGLLFNTAVEAANLMDVYQQALISDQIFQQAISQRMSTREGVPISLAGLLPSANILTTPTLSKSNVSGSNTTQLGSSSMRGYDVALTLNQTIFDFGKFSNLCSAKALSKQADATLNASAQDLMLRVAKAYFTVLKDEDYVGYTLASRDAFAKQLDQVTQQFNVGLKTITDVYTAKASYASSDADYIGGVTTLQNDKENLRVITGVFYPQLAKLSEQFPLISPQPANMEAWVQTAQQQNWSVKAAQYTADSARQNIKQQYAGHLPTMQVQGIYDVNYSNTSSGTPLSAIAGTGGTGNTVALGGTSKVTTTTGNLILNIPLVQGGAVVAQTHKAQYDYRIAISKVDQQVRTTVNTTRQSYLGVITGIKKISADKEAITSTLSSLSGLKSAYEVGTGTLVDVVNQQQKAVLAQRQYATDRYDYVNNLLSLKSAAGTLSYRDLEAINSWLRNGSDEKQSVYQIESVSTKSAKKYHKIYHQNKTCPH